MSLEKSNLTKEQNYWLELILSEKFLLWIRDVILPKFKLFDRDYIIILLMKFRNWETLKADEKLDILTFFNNERVRIEISEYFQINNKSTKFDTKFGVQNLDLIFDRVEIILSDNDRNPIISSISSIMNSKNPDKIKSNFSELAEYYFQLRDLHSSFKYAKKALIFSPNDEKAYNILIQLIDSYNNEFVYSEALNSLQDLILNNPNLLPWYLLCWYICNRLLRNEDAKWFYEKALIIDPNSVYALFYIWLDYWSNGQYNKALEFFMKVKNLDIESKLQVIWYIEDCQIELNSQLI